MMDKCKSQYHFIIYHYITRIIITSSCHYVLARMPLSHRFRAIHRRSPPKRPLFGESQPSETTAFPWRSPLRARLPWQTPFP